MSQIFSSEYFTDIVLALGGILIVNLIVRVIQYLISSKVKEKNLRYGLRSATSFFGYFLIFILLIGIFSNQLSKLAVVFGVAGAGIAFALQEVIVSVAGWIALSFGQFYAVGDRVQLGGIKGDVIDIGILRTIVFECRYYCFCCKLIKRLKFAYHRIFTNRKCGSSCCISIQIKI